MTTLCAGPRPRCSTSRPSSGAGRRPDQVPNNPFADPLLIPVALRAALVLVLGLAAVLLAERRPLRVLRRSTLFMRLRTWLWVAPLFVVVLFVGGLALFLGALFLTLQAAGEYARLVG